MADKNQLKVADLSGFGDDDPFAELTRIMGFDPRVPVQPRSEEKPVLAPVASPRPVEAVAPLRAVEPVAAVAPVAAPRAVTVEPELSDDFSIDLEREMLGAFSDDEPATTAPRAVHVEAAPPMRADIAPSVQAVEAPSFDGPSFDGPSFDEPSFDDLEGAFASSLEDELSLHHDDLPAMEIYEPALEAPVASAPVVADPVQEEIDMDFDLAMAEVDMDFGAPQGEEPFLAAGPAYEAEVAYDDVDFDLDLGEIELHEPQASEPVFRPAPANVQPAFESRAFEAPEAFMPAARPLPAAPAVVDEELSLEDELNALLGNPVSPAVLTSGYDHSPLTVASQASEEAELARWDDLDGDLAGESSHVRGYLEGVSHPAEPYVPDYADERRAIAGHDDAAPEFDDMDFDTAFDNTLAAVAPAAAAPLAARYMREDPHAAVAARSAPVSADERLYRAGAAPQPAYAPAAPLTEAPAGPRAASASSRYASYDAPDVDTVDVPEAAVAFADDLDLPELAYEDDVPAAASAYDDFDADFSNAFSDLAQPDESPRAAHPVRYDGAYGEPTRPARASAQPPAEPAYAAPQPAAAYDEPFDDYAGISGSDHRRDAVDELDYDEELDEAIAIPAYQSEQTGQQPRRGLLVAAVVGGVALLGAIGAFALSFGDSTGSDVPAVVRADDQPIKVRPENPGGTAVPNQENKVFDTLAGAGTATPPSQEKLITSAEEPVDMTARAEPALPAGDPAAKSEDRIDPASVDAETGADNMEVAAVAPRKVKTMVVRSDGTLVPREEPRQAIAAEPRASVEEQESALAPAIEEDVPTLPAPAGTAAPRAATPDNVPVAPQRPADQPVDVVGEVKPEQVAAVSGAAGAYSMQIASQPTEAGAQETYQDLARRYAGIIGGKPASIVKAEIPGKGTFWRVRISAESRNAAVSMCESYKSAGGNCFVSK